MDATRRFSFRVTGLFVLAVLACLSLRYGGVHFVGDSLWAEDGPVFYQGANDLGLLSLVKQYAGYLHVYPRAVALVSLGLSPSLVPYLFFGGWLLSLLVLRWALERFTVADPYGQYKAFFLPLLLLLQPSNGETLLSITNAQWWLAISLALMCAAPEKFGRKSLPIAAVISLTGPFSILFAPAAIARGFLEKRKGVPAIVTAGAIIQLIILLQNPRTTQALDTDTGHWLHQLTVFIGFGSTSTGFLVASAAFWLATVTLLKTSDSAYRFLIFCGLAAYASALLSLKGMPKDLSPLGMGARYYVLPYSIAVVAVFTSRSNMRWVKYTACLLVMFVFFASQTEITQQKLNYREFSKLADYEAVTKIPVAPVFQKEEPFTMTVRNEHPAIPSSALSFSYSDQGSPIAKSACGSNRGVGIAIDIESAEGAYIEYSWVNLETSARKSATRYFKAGDSRAQIVIKKGKYPVDIYLSPSPHLKISARGNGKVICL
jgi:hypothetical protein